MFVDLDGIFIDFWPTNFTDFPVVGATAEDAMT
jgi:hypothetical protein